MKEIFKILRPQAKNKRDLQLELIDTEGQRLTVTVVGLRPYAFVRMEDRMNIQNKFSSMIDEMVNEGFKTLENEKCLTIFFDKPGDVGYFRKEHNKMYEDMILQGDIPYEYACLHRMGVSRYVEMSREDIGYDGTIHYKLLSSPDSERIDNTEFPKYRKKYMDTEVIATEPEMQIEDMVEGKGKLVSAVINENAYLLLNHGENLKSFKHTIYDRTINVLTFTNERKMIREIYHDLLGGHIAIAWNSDFDRKYLENRSEELGLDDLDWTRIQWLDIQTAFAKNQDFSTNKISLKESFNLVYQYKRDSWSSLPDIFQDYYTIDEETMIPNLNTDSKIYKYINFRSRQSGGNVHGLYMSRKYKSLIFYNASDVFDLMALDVVAGVDNYISQYDTLGLMDLNSVFIHSWKIDPTPLRLAMMNKIASYSQPEHEVKKRRKEEKEEIEGAIVHDPETGKVLENVFMADFSRFYITIILALQVSPENVPDEDNQPLITTLPDGTELERPMYFLEALAFFLIQAREKAEEGLANAKNDYEKTYYGDLRGAFKTLTSGLWGYIADVTCRYYAKHCAVQILSESRAKNIALKDYAESSTFKCFKSSDKELTFRVVAGDTDSSFPCPNEKIDDIKDIDFDSINDQLNEFLVNLCNSQGYPVPITVKIEKVYEKLNLVAKKFYYGSIIWKDGKWLKDKSYDIKGMQTIRSDHSSFSKDFQYSIIINHLENEMEGILDTVKRFREKYFEGKENLDTEFIEYVSKPVSIKNAYPDYYLFETDKNGNIIKPRRMKSGTAYMYYAISGLAWNEYLHNLKGDHSEDMISTQTKTLLIWINHSNERGLRVNKGDVMKVEDADGKVWKLKQRGSYFIYTNANLLDWSKIKLNWNKIYKHNFEDKLNNILKQMEISDIEIDNISRGRKVHHDDVSLF